MGSKNGRTIPPSFFGQFLQEKQVSGLASIALHKPVAIYGDPHISAAKEQETASDNFVAFLSFPLQRGNVQ